MKYFEPNLTLVEKTIKDSKYLLIHEDITLRVDTIVDDFIDYTILIDDVAVGYLGIRNTEDFIFIRQIRIYKEYRHQGYASCTVDGLLKYFNKKIKLCVATNSESAVSFWKTYLGEQHKVLKERGNIFCIYPKRT